MISGPLSGDRHEILRQCGEILRGKPGSFSGLSEGNSRASCTACTDYRRCLHHKNVERPDSAIHFMHPVGRL